MTNLDGKMKVCQIFKFVKKVKLLTRFVISQPFWVSVTVCGAPACVSVMCFQ